MGGLGLWIWVQKCQEATDWENTCEPKVLYSPDSHLHIAHPCPQLWYRGLKPQKDSIYFPVSRWSTSHPHPADDLWAQHNYDVGLIKDCEPVRITPESDYRLCRHQHPLKPEAITPLFESSKAAGVIVHCEYSPVWTPLFPMKKIRKAGQPTEWFSGPPGCRCGCTT